MHKKIHPDARAFLKYIYCLGGILAIVGFVAWMWHYNALAIFVGLMLGGGMLVLAMLLHVLLAGREKSKEVRRSRAFLRDRRPMGRIRSRFAKQPVHSLAAAGAVFIGASLIGSEIDSTAIASIGMLGGLTMFSVGAVMALHRSFPSQND